MAALSEFKEQSNTEYKVLGVAGSHAGYESLNVVADAGTLNTEHDGPDNGHTMDDRTIPGLQRPSTQAGTNKLYQ